MKETEEYIPNICPKCGGELITEANMLTPRWFNREVYCDNPDCDWQGGIEAYRVGDTVGFSFDGYCSDCSDEESGYYEEMKPCYLDDNDVDFDAKRVFVEYECPECGKVEETTVAIEFNDFSLGERLY